MEKSVSVSDGLKDAVEKLKELVPLNDLQPKVSEIYPSRGSLEWFYRTHREELISSGAVFLIAGRLLAHPTTFAHVALQIGERAARGGTRDSVMRTA